MSESGDMQELFKEAAKIAAVVPESMQEAAFHRALDMLTGTVQTAAKSTAAPHPAAKKRTSSGGTGDAGTPASDRVAQVTAISRDNAQDVDQETSILGRSIALLVVASREADVDGLTAPEIAKILTEKFRQKTNRQSVQWALDTAGNKIDRQKNGNGAAVYRVMRPGEDWLSKSADERKSSSGSQGRSRPKTKKAATSAPTKATSTKNSGSAKKSAAAPRPSNAGRKTGPKGALETLISEGYFSEPRGMADIRQDLRDKKAMSFESTDLSPALTRLLREGKLERTKSEKQYVYTAG